METRENFEEFLINKIQFPDWREALASDKLKFVKILLQKFQYHSYFHNIILASTDPLERKSPTVDDYVDEISNGRGGICVHQNGFMAILLKSLGFDAYMSSGNCVGSVLERDGNHCMCILKMTESEIYAIDVGCAFPLNDPIPLHKLPHQEYSAGFRYEYRFNKEENVYEMLQFDGTFFRGKFEDPSTVQLRYKFSLTPQDSKYFETTVLDVFTDPITSTFLQCPLIFRSLDIDPDDLLENGRRYVLMFGASMVIYDNDNRNVTDFSSYFELEPEILKHFYTIDPKLVRKALEYFSSHDSPLILGSG